MQPYVNISNKQYLHISFYFLSHTSYYHTKLATYPSLEINISALLNKHCSHVAVAIVRSNVQGREASLKIEVNTVTNSINTQLSNND